jgi:hypothetical protein
MALQEEINRILQSTNTNDNDTEYIRAHTTFPLTRHESAKDMIVVLNERLFHIPLEGEFENMLATLLRDHKFSFVNAETEGEKKYALYLLMRERFYLNSWPFSKRDGDSFKRIELVAPLEDDLYEKKDANIIIDRIGHQLLSPSIIDKLKGEEAVHKKMGYKRLSPEVEFRIQEVTAAEKQLLDLIRKVEGTIPTDSRWVEISKTEIEKGFMFLRRAIAKPTLNIKE